MTSRAVCVGAEGAGGHSTNGVGEPVAWDGGMQRSKRLYLEVVLRVDLVRTMIGVSRRKGLISLLGSGDELLHGASPCP